MVKAMMITQLQLVTTSPWLMVLQLSYPLVVARHSQYVQANSHSFLWWHPSRISQSPHRNSNPVNLNSIRHVTPAPSPKQGRLGLNGRCTKQALTTSSQLPPPNPKLSQSRTPTSTASSMTKAKLKLQNVSYLTILDTKTLKEVCCSKSSKRASVNKKRGSKNLRHMLKRHLSGAKDSMMNNRIRPKTELWNKKLFLRLIKSLWVKGSSKNKRWGIKLNRNESIFSHSPMVTL